MVHGLPVTQASENASSTEDSLIAPSNLTANTTEGCPIELNSHQPIHPNSNLAEGNKSDPRFSEDGEESLNMTKNENSKTVSKITISADPKDLSRYVRNWNADDRRLFELLSELYPNRLHYFFDERPQKTIPKIIHQVWVGPNPLPTFYEEFKNSWLQHNPDWEYRLWRDEDLVNFTNFQHEAYLGPKDHPNHDQWFHLSHRSNLIRFELLHRYGGLYVDTDFKCLKNFDELITRSEFIIGLQQTDKFETNGALMASIPGHPFIAHLMDDVSNGYQEWLKKPKYSPYGPKYLTKKVWEYLKENKSQFPLQLMIYPIDFFYPALSDDVKKMYEDFESRKPINEKGQKWMTHFTENTHAVHYWAYLGRVDS